MTDQYNNLYDSFEWLVPTYFNIAETCCHRWASSPHEARQIAVYFEDQVGQLTILSYGQLSEQVNKLANSFIRMGIQPQDRIAIALQHSAESAITQLAALTVGAIAVPLTSSLSSAEYSDRLIDARPRVVIVDKHSITAVMGAIDNHSPIKQIIGIHTDDDRVIPWRSLLARQSGTFSCYLATANTPAFLMYPEPSENKPLRGKLINHSALIGTLPGFVASQNWFPKSSDVFWTSYDWNTQAGLLQALLPTLYFGRSIVGCPSGRTIPRLFTLLEHYQISNLLISSHELNRIKQYPDLISLSNFDLGIRCISMPDTEATDELDQWTKERFNTHINKFLSLEGIAYVIGDSHDKWPSKSNSIGRAYPGHQLGLIDSDLKLIEKNDEIGEMVIYKKDIFNYPDPAVYDAEWAVAQIHDLDKQQAWIRTGINAYKDKDGYYYRAKN